MLASVDVGTLGQWVLVAVGLFVAWRISRGGGGSALHELSEANRVLERRLHELSAEVRDLKIENAELRGRTDISAVIESTRDVIATHEDRALARHEAVLNVLGLIADRIGPDPH